MKFSFDFFGFLLLISVMALYLESASPRSLFRATLSCGKEFPQEALRNNVYYLPEDVAVSRVQYALPKRESYISSDVLTSVTSFCFIFFFSFFLYSAFVCDASYTTFV